ncbi:MAG: YidC/Oxa1 family membrane protein insertase [bacterium]
MDFTSITVEILKTLSHIAGSYGFAIILLTVIVRLAMWPLSVSQQKSMQKMQELSPKLKEIQNRYGKDPQMMQRKMQEFYKEHKFNPFGGCFPLLLQMPVFILLYTALVSPQFIEAAGNTSFLFINRLDATIRSHAGKVGDHVFGVEKNDNFSSVKTALVYINNGVVEDVKIKNPGKAIQKQGEIIPGNPLDLKLNIDELDLSFNELSKVKKANISVINNNTKEIENITFDRKDSYLTAMVATEQVKTVFHYDVFALVILFGLTMFLAQKIMSSASANAAADPKQKEMQEQMSKIMPIMITSTFIFIPIPAGVLLYMVVSNIIQVFQTFIINKQLEKEKDNKPKIVENIDNLKTVKNKKSKW